MSRARLIIFAAFVFYPTAASPQGNPLGPEFRVNTSTTFAQRRPSVAADASGNFVAVWASENQDGGASGIFGQRYSIGGIPLGPEFRVNTYTTDEQAYPSIASDTSGNFVVVWSSRGQDGWDDGIFGQRYDASGSPLGAEFRVNTSTYFDQRRPSVATDSSGNFVVVWSSDSIQLPYGGPPVVLGQRYASSGNALGTAFRVNDSPVGDAPTVATDPVGNFVVVWANGQIGSAFNIAGRRFANTGAPLGPEFQVNTSMPGYPSGPDVAVDASGDFVVAWSVSDPFAGFPGEIFGQRYASNGMPVGPEFQIAPAPEAQGVPSLEADADGNFVVVWQASGPDGSGYGVFGQRYASDGALLGSEFRINTYTTTNQRMPAVATDPAGSFVVVWESQNQDGSGDGVFGQRYRPIVPVTVMDFTIE
jgi:large repetitive protein